jgi:hypothetical protein
MVSSLILQRAEQRLGKHVPAATNTHSTIEVLLETVRVFPTRYVLYGCVKQEYFCWKEAAVQRGHEP